MQRVAEPPISPARRLNWLKDIDIGEKIVFDRLSVFCYIASLSFPTLRSVHDESERGAAQTGAHCRQ